MKRNDAKEVFDIPVFNKFFPFLMKRRCDALVYQTITFDMTNAVEFVRRYNKEHPDEGRLKVFSLYVAAMMRLMALRPELNRFIAGSRYWQRNELSVNFIIKESFDDHAPERSDPLVIPHDATLPEVAKLINDKIDEARSEDGDTTADEAIGLFMKFPKWVIKAIVGIAGFLDHHGKAPAILREADGMHTSLYISNLGSIGLMAGPTFHHLYEWGTTSMFQTMGSVNRRVVFDEDGKVTKKYDMTVGVTLDERICDGFYFVKSFMILQDLINHPEKLMERPELPPPLMTKKEYQAKMKAEKKARKLAARAKAKEAPAAPGSETD